MNGFATEKIFVLMMESFAMMEIFVMVKVFVLIESFAMMEIMAIGMVEIRVMMCFVTSLVEMRETAAG